MRGEVQKTIQEAIQKNAEEIDLLRSRLDELEAEQADLSSALSALAPDIGPPMDDEETSVVTHTGKYKRLWDYLQARSTDRVSMTFTEIENDVLGFPLPPSSRNHLPHWYGYKGSAVTRAIQDAGWRSTNVNLSRETVIFVRR